MPIRMTFQRQPMDHRVEKVIEVVLSNLQQKVSIEELSLTVNLSPSRLRWLFKVETGISFARYLRMMRMREAKHLLETTFLSVKEIMLKVGMGDESHFVRNFEKAFGLAPAKYRDRFLRGKLKDAARQEPDQ